jgi:hypothetical protein
MKVLLPAACDKDRLQPAARRKTRYYAKIINVFFV